MISTPDTLRFRQQGLALLRDDAAASRRAVLVAAASSVSVSTMNLILEISSGPVFVALSEDRAAAFMLSSMSRPRLSTAPLDESSFSQYVSVEAREGVTTGISASDRCTTVRILGETEPQPRRIVSPGHIFPLRARNGGVLVKNALPEGALDLARLSDQGDAAALVDLLNASGEFMSAPEQDALAAKLNIPVFTLSDIVHLRLGHENLVYRVAEARLPSRLAGELRSYVYKSSIHEGEHLALVKGDIHSDKPVLTRVQPENTAADVFGIDNPASRRQIHNSLRAIGERGCGVLIYLRQPYGKQLKEQILQQNNQEKSRAGSGVREYGLGAQILHDLGVRKLELLTNSGYASPGLATFGLEIVSQRPIPEYSDE